MAELLARAQQLLAAGPYDARPAEIAAVLDTIWPEKAPVCPTLTCMRALGVAYYAIKRWAESQQDSSSTLSTSSTVNKPTVTARFKSAHTIYTPHGLGIAYSNDNLTDKAARYILKNDPDAAGLFSELPPEASDEEEQASPAATPAETSAPAPVAAGEIDYTKLAQAIVDIQNKAKAPAADAEVQELTQEAKENGQPLPSSTSRLTASAGGAPVDATDKEVVTTSVVEPAHVEVTTGQPADNEAPVRLSRMNKELLVATYTAELGQAPAESLTNDNLRDAIAEKRASQQDPE